MNKLTIKILLSYLLTNKINSKLHKNIHAPFMLCKKASIDDTKESKQYFLSPEEYLMRKFIIK